MGRSRWRTIWAWTATVGDLVDARARVIARCSRCRSEREVDLDRLMAERGRLYTLWNRTPACRTEGCDDRVVFIAAHRDDCAWPVTMSGAEPGQVAFLEAEWRASRVASEAGVSFVLALAAGMLDLLHRAGAMDEAARERTIQSALGVVPGGQREDVRWLLDHLVSRGRDRPGWR